jgi:ADP-ribose 1''-phosphate phosphatase
MSVTYVKGDLFNAPKGSVLAHACNCEGVWGAGIAVEFKRRFPKAHEAYRRDCATPWSPLGGCLVRPEGGYIVLCLYTSERRRPGPQLHESILRETESALRLATMSTLIDKRPIHMPKINSGLFGVPWEKTLAVLEKIDYPFVVYEL